MTNANNNIKARHSLECYLHDENHNYYNALGVNFKLHRQYRHTWIAIEVRGNHPVQGMGIPISMPPPQYTGGEYIEQQYPIKGASTSETSPLVYAIPQQQQPQYQQQQQQPQVYAAPPYPYVQQDPYGYPYKPNN